MSKLNGTSGLIRDGRLGAAAAIAASALFASSALATTYTWTRGAGNNNWDNGLNWTSDDPEVAPPPVPNTPPEGHVNDLRFTVPVTGSATTTPRITTTANPVEFYVTNSFYFGPEFNPNNGTSFTIGGSSNIVPELYLGAGGITTFNDNYSVNFNSSSSTSLFRLNLTADQTWAVHAPALSTGARTLTMNSVIAGEATVTKEGVGILVLRDASPDWSGGIILNEGVIRTGSVGHQLHFGTGAVTHSTENDVSITSSLVGGQGEARIFQNDFILGNSGQINFGGSFDIHFGENSTITLLNDKRIGISHTSEVRGTITGDGGINKHSGGTLVLMTANSFTGGLTAVNGTVRVTHSQGLGAGSSPVSIQDGAVLELDGGISVDARPLVIAGSGLEVEEPATPAGALRNTSGNNTWGGGLAVAGPDSLVAVEAGSLNFGGGVTDVSTEADGSLRKIGPGLLSVQQVQAQGLHVDEGTVRLAGANQTSQVSDLSIAGGAAVDLAAGSLRVVNGDVSAIHALVASGNAGGWTGSGINSSTAAADGQFAVGVAPDAADVLVRLTYGGDASLDGAVTIADLGILAANWQQSGKHWFEGDFNFDQQVTIADLGILAANWQKGAGGGMSFEEALAMFDVFEGVVVPEPSVLGVLLLGSAGTLLRRRRL
jgi:hypothetical protein